MVNPASTTAAAPAATPTTAPDHARGPALAARRLSPIWVGAALISAVLCAWSLLLLARAPVRPQAHPAALAGAPVGLAVPAAATVATVRPRAASADVAILVDRSLDGGARLEPVLSGRLHTLSDPDDLAAVAELLRDPAAGDTERNEAANLLLRSGHAGLADDLALILARDQEGERFRSFAAQHLGLCWQSFAASAAVHERLRALLDDRHLAVRREALLVLARAQDTAAVARLPALAAAPGGLRDLAVRLIGDLDLRAELPAVRAAAGCEQAAVRLAALDVLERWGDRGSADAFAAAASSSDEQVRAAGRRGLARLAASP